MVHDLAAGAMFSVSSQMVRAWWPDGLRVRRGSGVCQQHLNLTPSPGGTMSGRKNPKVCLEIDRSPKTPANEVESKR